MTTIREWTLHFGRLSIVEHNVFACSGLKVVRVVVVLITCLATMAPIAAQERNDQIRAQAALSDAPWRFAEVRIGILSHDVRIAGGREKGVDVNMELTSSTLVDPGWGGSAPVWTQWILHPRLHVGTEINTSGFTSQLYGGLTWSTLLFQRCVSEEDAIEFSYLFGPSANDGDHHEEHNNTKSLGSNLLFHLGAEMAYRLTGKLTVAIYLDHVSNAGFARYNQSINDGGLRLSHRF